MTGDNAIPATSTNHSAAPSTVAVRVSWLPSSQSKKLKKKSTKKSVNKSRKRVRKEDEDTEEAEGNKRHRSNCEFLRLFPSFKVLIICFLDPPLCPPHPPFHFFVVHRSFPPSRTS